MTEDCKELEKKAKELEKSEPVEAVNVYKQASECYAKHDKMKDKNSNLLKAAKLLRELGKSNEDPTVALDYYEESSSMYTEIEKEDEAEKVIQEAYQKFAEAAKLLILEARKMDDIEASEKKLKLASQYAKLAEDEELSNRSWVESGDQYYKAAKVIEEPREAFEVFKHSIINYNKGKATEKQDLLLTDAAEKFSKKGTEIYKTNKTLVLALDNYVQATTLFQAAKSEQKLKDVDKRIQEICDKIGIPKDPIINYLDLQGIKAVSFDEAIQIAVPIVEQILDVDKSDIGFTEKERETEPSIVSTTPEVMDEIKSTAPELEMEEIESPKVEEPKEELVFTPPPEIIEEVEASVSPDIVQPEILDTIPEPRMERVETPKVEEPVEEPAFTPPPEVIEEVEASVSPDIVHPEILDVTPVPQMEVVETPKIEEPVEEPAFTPLPEAIEEVAANVSSEIVQPEIRDTIPVPRREEIETPKFEEPVITPPPEEREEVEATISSDVFQPEILDITPEPQKDEKELPDPSVYGVKQDIEIESTPELKIEEKELPDPSVYGIKKEFENESTPELKIEEKELPDPLVYGIKKEFENESTLEPHQEEKYTSKVEDPKEISQPKTFEKTEEKKGIAISGLKPMAPLKEEEKPDLAHKLASPTSGTQDYQKESLTPDTSKAQIPDESGFVPKAGDLQTLSEPIMVVLRQQGYIKKDMNTIEELLQVSEYQLLLFLANNHPVPLEEIEEKTDVISVSLSLSNLQADGLIEQTNDYQWTISGKVKQSIS